MWDPHFAGAITKLVEVLTATQVDTAVVVDIGSPGSPVLGEHVTWLSLVLEHPRESQLFQLILNLVDQMAGSINARTATPGWIGEVVSLQAVVITHQGVAIPDTPEVGAANEWRNGDALAPTLGFTNVADLKGSVVPSERHDTPGIVAG